MSTERTMTRYDRVKEILDAAAGESSATYGGVGRFWHLPLDRFLDFTLDGVRLIAPAKKPPGSCCSNEPTASAESEPAGRGESSGLTRGLRGQPPFDGSVFPRLPWGGEAVAAIDIDFISSWIDDGCPESDHVLLTADLDPRAERTAVEPLDAHNAEAGFASPVFEVYPGTANDYKYQRGELKQRMNIDCMDEVGLDKLRYAFRELYKLNKWPEDARSYNSIAFVHQNHCQHGWERFLPWHRIYMYEFEQALQDVCPEVTLPYWDWTMPQYAPATPEKGCRIPPSLQAYLTEASIEWLTRAAPALPSAEAEVLRKELVGRRFYSQHTFFAAVARLIGENFTLGPHRLRFIDALLAANALWYPLRYPGEYRLPDGSPATINQAANYHYPTADDIAQILSLRTFRDFGGGSLYNDAFGFLDQNPHNTLHIWTGGENPDAPKSPAEFGAVTGSERNRGVEVAGRHYHSRSDLYGQPAVGDMYSNLTASFDPIFWPVHANVDRLWWEWQQIHPNSNPVELDAVLTPWSYTIADTLDVYRFGYEYVKSTYILPVGLSAPVGRFVSKAISIPEAVRGGFRQAEVRLHRVPQLPRSCFVRVFLNLPDANAGTSIEDEHYAGYLAVFGHAACIGGPGHCDLPPDRARKYDQRPRHHNTPRNHRIDVTDCARKLLAAGASDLTITLVVIGADYREDKELLRLEGVSLNFLD